MEKIFNLIKKHRKQILKILLIIVVIIAMAIGGYFILKACGFTTKEDIEVLRDNLGDSVWFWVIIGSLQVFQVIFIPVSNQIITIPCALVFYNELWKVFLTSWLAIWLATLILYFIGRWGGAKLLGWVLGDKEQVDKCSKWLNKGWVFYPLGMLLPLPDDIITALAGTAKFKFGFVALCSLLTRAVDVACSVWGWGYLTRYWWGWVILSAGIVLLGLMTLLFYKWQKKRDIKAKEKADAKQCPYKIE